MSEKPLIILTGPTAVGKTKLSIQLAKAIHGEIISADSMQVYKGMDIGTAKITQEEKEGITHYLLDILSPEEDFNVVMFRKLAMDAIRTIYEKGKIPILVGGTGFYIQSVLYDISFSQTNEDGSYREFFNRIAEEKGEETLYQMLLETDSAYAETVHPNNRKRVIRALEFHALTGKKLSEHNQEQQQNVSPFQFAYFVIHEPREILYEKINQRVDNMFENGLVKEVSKLLADGLSEHAVSMQGIGYKEVASYLHGEISEEEAKECIKKNTRHFAKRQLTWFRREKDVIWLQKGNDETALLTQMLHMLYEKDILTGKNEG